MDDIDHRDDAPSGTSAGGSSAAIRPRRRRGAPCAIAAAAAYLAIALWSLADVLPVGTTHLLGLEKAAESPALGPMDLQMVLGTVTRNARALFDSSLDVLGAGACYPFPEPYTLGEHMLGTSLLAAAPLALSGSPTLAYNLALVSTFWIAAAAMYALAFHFTRDAVGAFVAGLLFSFTQARLSDLVHPFVYGIQWIPLVMLFLHRTVARRRWTDAGGLAVFGVLALGESFYALLSGTLLVGVYAAALLIRRRDPRSWVRVLGAAAVVGVVAATLFAPYLEVRRVWGVLQGRTLLLATPARYGFGNISFPGLVACSLAALALLDRARRRRTCADGEDPRIAIAIAGFVAFWCSVWKLPLGSLGALPSPLWALRDVVPPLRSVRVTLHVGTGVSLAVAFLAAYGAKCLSSRASPPLRLGVAFVLSLAILFESFDPRATAWSFGAVPRMVPLRLAPPAADLALLAKLPPGAVADLPTAGTNGRIANAHPLLLSAFHGRPTSACYNSFLPATSDQVRILVWNADGRPFRDALSALGFGSILVHKHRLDERRLEELRSKLEGSSAQTGVRKIGESSQHLAYQLFPAQSRSSFRLLQAENTAELVRLEGRHAKLRMVFKNSGPLTFRHPDPQTPSDVLLRWYRGPDQASFESRSRVLLPIALGRGGSLAVELDAELPPPGTYRVDLVRAGAPSLVLARRWVQVDAARPAARLSPQGGAAT